MSSEASTLQRKDKKMFRILQTTLILTGCLLGGVSSSSAQYNPANPVHGGGQPDYFPGDKWMMTNATLYRDGTYVINTQSRSNNTSEGLWGRVFLVFVDIRGRAIGMTPIYNCKTCCSTWDFTGPSGQVDAFTGQIPPAIALYTFRIDVYHFDGGGEDFWKRLAWNIKRGSEFYNDLPPQVRMAIGSLVVPGN